MGRLETLPTRDKIISLARERGALRPFPANVLKLIQIIRDPEFSTDEMITVIEREPAIAVKVLAAANSPLYGCSRQIDSIGHAVVVLGIRSVTEQVVNFATNDLYGNASADSAYADRLYKHSLGCALVARELTTIVDSVDATDAFLHGLLHDVGKLIFSSVVPEYNQQFANRVEFGTLIEQETNTFGIDHQEIGSNCVANWGFPEDLINTISFHHGTSETPLESTVAQIVEAANWLTRSCGIGTPTDETLVGGCQWNDVLALVTNEQQQQMIETAAEEMQQLLAIT